MCCGTLYLDASLHRSGPKNIVFRLYDDTIQLQSKKRLRSKVILHNNTYTLPSAHVCGSLAAYFNPTRVRVDPDKNTEEILF